MRKLIKWCNWELKNDYAASAYFAVMLLMYCILDFILGVKSVDILVIFEMFLTNYVLSILNKLFLDEEKEYSAKSFIVRGVMISVISVIIVIAAGSLGGWFVGMPLWAGIIIYLMLILTYLTIWVIIKLDKKYDTQKLNEQLANFKKNNNNFES